MNRLRSVAASVALVSLVTSTTGCAQLMQLGSLASAANGAPNQGATPSSRPSTKTSAESWAALKKRAETDLEQCEKKTVEANTKLAEVVAKFEGKGNDAMGKPLPHINTVVAKLAKEKVSFSIEDKGAPTRPMLFLKDSLMDEGMKIQGAPQAKMMAFAKRSQAVQPSVNALRDQVMSVNAAVGVAAESMMSCSLAAKGYSTTLGAMENGGEQAPEDVFAVYAKLLQANKRSEAVIAASVALLAAAQAGAAGKNPKATDVLLDGVKSLKDNPETVTPELAKQVYKAAGQALVDGCQANLDKYYADHPEAKKPAGPSPCSKEGLAADREKRAAGPGAATNGGGAKGGDIDEAVRRLLPKDTPLGDAADAFLALKKGDYVGGLKSSLKLVGKNMPFGGAVSSVLGLLG